jgi:subtilisin-like proprotein convertase family protein
LSLSLSDDGGQTKSITVVVINFKELGSIRITLNLPLNIEEVILLNLLSSQIHKAIEVNIRSNQEVSRILL